MQMIDDLIDQVKLSNLDYSLSFKDKRILRFEEEFHYEVPEGKTPIERLIINEIGRNIAKRSNGKCGYSMMVQKESVQAGVERRIREFHIKLWMLVNKKKVFKRTSIHKTIDFASRNLEARKIFIDLYVDATNYGIDPLALSEHTEMKPIHKFIAAKFQAAVEATACPR